MGLKAANEEPKSPGVVSVGSALVSKFNWSFRPGLTASGSTSTLRGMPLAG